MTWPQSREKALRAYYANASSKDKLLIKIHIYVITIAYVKKKLMIMLITVANAHKGTLV